MQQIKLNNELLKRIKKIIDREQSHDKKSIGFSQLTQWYATQHMTLSQAQQILSFYNKYNESTAENKEQKKAIYDELNIKPFCDNWVKHYKRLEASKRKAKQTYTTNRTIDRMNTINTTPLKATPHTKDIKVDGLNEGLKRKQFRVTYSSNKTRFTTILHLYSQSETEAVERLKMTNYRLKGKHIVILNIVPL